MDRETTVLLQTRLRNLKRKYEKIKDTAQTEELSELKTKIKAIEQLVI